MRSMKRILSLLLALVLVAGYLPGKIQVRASQEDGLCPEHHAQHNEDCGYVAAKAEIPCSHTSCNEECLTRAVTHCVFPHESCDCAEAVPGRSCAEGSGCTTDDAGVLTHVEGCGYVVEQAAVVCGHVCTVDTGCITMACSHEHGAACGYASAVEGDACAYAGVPCAQCQDGEKDGEPEEDGEQEENCTLKEGCTLKAGHENQCAWACGCPVDEAGHLATCAQAIDTEPQQMPLYYESDGAYKSELSLDFGVVSQNLLFYTSASNSAAAVIPQVTQGSEIIQLKLSEDKVTYRIYAMKPGEATLSYTDAMANIVYSMKVVVKNAHLEMKYENTNNRLTSTQMSLGQSSRASFFLRDDFGEMGIEGVPLTSSDESVLKVLQSYPTFFYELQAVGLGQADVIYTAPSGGEMRLTVTVDYALEAKIEDDFYPELWFTTGVDTPLQFFLSGMETPLTGVEAGSNVITLTESEENPGNYTLKANRAGVTSVVYKQSEKTYTCKVTVTDPVETEGYLHYMITDDIGNHYPITCMDMAVNDERGRFIYFGETQMHLNTEGFSYSGPIQVSEDSQGMLVIKAIGAGTGYLEYKTTETVNGVAKEITNCFVINISQYPGQRPSGTAEGSYMRFGNTDIGFGDTGLSADGQAKNMILDHEVKGAYSNTYSEPYRQQALLAAIGKDGLPDMDLIRRRISNVEFSVLSVVYTDGLPTDAGKLKTEVTDSVWVEIEDAIGTYGNYYLAGESVGFKAKLGVKFDLVDGGKTRRISLFTHSHNMFMGNEVRVVLHDIDTAPKLNAILSSRQALLNYIADRIEENPEQKKIAGNTPHKDDMGLEYAKTACTINIILPAEDLTEAVVVSQTIGELPFTEVPISTPDFRITMEGQGEDTVMAGLISKGSLFGVVNVAFKADPTVAMTRDGTRFTCGILADPTWDGEVAYDNNYYAAYADESDVRKLAHWGSNDLKDWHCDVGTVMYCSFDGFDYGMYSNAYGSVGGGMGNSFSNCYYGIYIDSAAKSGWVNLKARADYSGYRFHKNVYAVRIKGLQENMSPYDFRIHDSDFINNFVEFFIDEYNTDYLQNYYFYRNHYRGNWNGKVVGWVQHKDEGFGAGTDSAAHRAPEYKVLDKNGAGVINGSKVTISGTPGKATAHFADSRSAGAEGYWIYDDAEQITRILPGENIPIAQESLNALERDTDVSLVDGSGTNTIAVWTFEGGE